MTEHEMQREMERAIQDITPEQFINMDPAQYTALFMFLVTDPLAVIIIPEEWRMQ